MPSKTVLIVEDDKSIRESLSTLLEMENFLPLCASNGEAGIEILKGANLPDLILLDLMMPIMDGAQFRERQLQMSHAKDIPVIVMSADSNIVAKQNTLNAFGYIKKPLDADDLLARLDEFFARLRQNDSPRD